ncbi:MAG: hypothetical protein JNM30_03960 [Rhodospirillales bacterium]|nr:hypothetical protein [Rhodospirillales bacterium]
MTRALLAAILVCFACPAFAHGVGERYDLPVPLGYYTVGAALVVVLTFVAAAAMPAHWGRAVAAGRVGVPVPRWTILVAQGLSVALLVLIVATGLLGDPHPARNLAPTLVWVVWWCGLGLVVAFVVDPWPALNPWRVLFCAVATQHAPPAAYPAWLGVWPAVVLLLLFAWIEVVSPLSSSPAAIAWLALGYTVVTWIGMARVGAGTWLARVDPFAILFATLGRLSPLKLSDGPQRRLALRWPGSALLEAGSVGPGMAAFVVAMLSTVLFDGFLGTALWRSWDRFVTSLLPRGMDREGYIAATSGLVAIWLGFLAAYGATCWATALMGGRRHATRTYLQAFSLTLVPIAVGYNLAHNFSYVVIQGQSVLALASDPFGWGWNLFGTAGFKPDIGQIQPATTWIVAVGAIVLAHVVAVVLAHLVALRLFQSRGLALRALVPMTVLMVLYTMASLTILAEPITRFSAPDPGYTMLDFPDLLAEIARPDLGC